MDIGKAAEAHLRQLCHLVARNHVPYHGGVPEYSAVPALAEHLVKAGADGLESISLKHSLLQRGRLRTAHWRQLGVVTDKHEVAVLSGVDKADEVGKEAPAAERRL